MIASIGARINEGFQRSVQNAVWQIVGNALSLGGLLVVVYMNLSWTWLLLATFGLMTLSNLLNAASTIFFMNAEFRPSCRFFDKDEAEKLLRAGSIFFLLSTTTFIGIYADPIILANMLGVEAVAQFAIVQRMSQVAVLFQAVITAMWPMYGEALARGEIAWVRTAFFRVLLGSVTAGVILAIILVLAGPIAAAFWINGEIVPPTSLFMGFASYIVVTALIGSVATVLNVTQFLKFQLLLLIISSAVSLLLKYSLVGLIGVSGTIWATSLAFLVFFVVPGYLYINAKIFSQNPPGKR